MHTVITGYRLTDDIYCRLTDIGACQSENKGRPKQSECLLGVDAQRKLIKQRSTGRHPVYPHGNWNLFVPSFYGPFILWPTPAALVLFCFTHKSVAVMFDLKPAALYWSDKWLQCEQIASSTHLLPSCQFIFFHNMPFNSTFTNKTKIPITVL